MKTHSSMLHVRIDTDMKRRRRRRSQRWGLRPRRPFDCSSTESRSIRLSPSNSRCRTPEPEGRWPSRKKSRDGERRDSPPLTRCSRSLKKPAASKRARRPGAWTSPEAFSRTGAPFAFGSIRHESAQGGHAPPHRQRGSARPDRRDHALKGAWANHRECHVGGDFLLINQVDDSPKPPVRSTRTPEFTQDY